MQVRRSINFENELDLHLAEEGRPNREHFETHLWAAVELTIKAFWGDETITPLVTDESEVRFVRMDPPPPYMFPPSTFYAHQISPEAVEVIGVDFDWNFWHERGEVE